MIYNSESLLLEKCMRYRILLGFLVVVLVSGTAALAHHSFAATYDVESEVRLEGRLVQFALRNPHSYVHVVAATPDGAPERWAIEWSGVGALTRQGIGQESLKIGDQVVITASPSRVRGEYKALMLTLLRPSDGLTWGTEPEQVVD